MLCSMIMRLASTKGIQSATEAVKLFNTLGERCEAKTLVADDADDGADGDHFGSNIVGNAPTVPPTYVYMCYNILFTCACASGRLEKVSFLG